jgi:AcrR family transcriptional regulator
MVRPRTGTSPSVAANLDESFWNTICGISQPSTREKFLYLTIEEFGTLGPGGFRHKEVVERLGYTMAMVNHYFGSRAGLIAEAASTVYDLYVDAMGRAVAEAPRTPRDRLRAWMTTQVHFALERPGWMVVLNYPDLALENPVEFNELFRAQMTRGFELNLCRLAQLILDVKSESVSDVELTEDNFDRAFYLGNARLVELTASVAMSTLGSAVWGAGSHAPSQSTAEALALRDHVIATHHENVIHFIEQDGI